MIQIADNFEYLGPKPNFERDAFKTLEEMKSVQNGSIDDGHISYCIEDKTHYDYLSSRTTDAKTGKWRVWKPIDDSLSSTSENPVQNKVIQASLSQITTNFETLKKKVEGIVIDDTLRGDSENAIQNKAVFAALTIVGTQISGVANDISSLEKEVVKKSDVDVDFIASSENPVQNKILTVRLAGIENQILNLQKKVNDIPPIDTALSASSTNPVQNKAVTSTVNDIKKRLDQAEFEITGLKYFGSYSYCVADWSSTNRLTPTANDMYGDPELLQWDFYLVDHSATPTDDGTRLKPEAKLCRNNIFKDTNGNYVKTVFTNISAKGRYVDSDGVTKSAFATNMRLYTNSTCTAEYVMSSAFSPEEFIKMYGKAAKLYVKKTNNQPAELFDIPRPWEEYQQTGAGFSSIKSVVLSLPRKVYLLDQLQGKSGKIWKGIFYEPCIWDGIDVSKYPLDTTGIFASTVPATVDSGTTKFFCRYLGFYVDDSGNLKIDDFSKGSAGTGDRSSVFLRDSYTISNQNYQKGCFSRNFDTNQRNTITLSRNNNPNKQSPTPFAEGGWHSRNTFVTSQEILYKTKNLGDTNFFATGITPVNSISTEAQWKVFGGIRWKQAGESKWSYGTWTVTPSDVCYNNTGGKTSWSKLLNDDYPKEQCMESQTYASYAYEMGIAPEVEFQYDSDKDWWYYKNIPNTKGLADGEMNCLIYKRMPRTITFFNTSGTPTDFDVEIILRMSLINGYTLLGDVKKFFGGGFEIVATDLKGVNNTPGNPIKIYCAFDQKNWRSTTELQTTVLDNFGTFVFENDPNYVKLLEGESANDNYTEIREPYTCFKVKDGGSYTTGECCYVGSVSWYYTKQNQRLRLGVFTRDGANSMACNPRCFNYSYVMDPFRWWKENTGSAQVLLDLSNV